ncbi:MAG: DNA methyltransferase, partial [Haloplanus sp.]
IIVIKRIIVCEEFYDTLVDLLERIVEASSNEGDLVLDCFMGSGTTLAAADKLNRNWIGIDKGDEAFNVTRERLKQESGHSPFETYEVK